MTSIDVAGMAAEFEREHRILQTGFCGERDMTAAAACVCASRQLGTLNESEKTQCQVSLMYLIAAERYHEAADYINRQVRRQ